MAKILLVEDESDVASVIVEKLEEEHHVVHWLADGQSAVDDLRVNKYDLIILDWMLPKVDGLQICRQYRSKGGTAHVLMLTARDTLDDKTTGLDCGADDYLSKPFHLKELLARTRALLRRPAARVDDSISVGNISVDTRTATVRREQEEILLVPKEYDLLVFLMKHPGQSFSAEALLERVWPSSSVAMPETVRTHIKTLRKKIDVPGQPSLIKHSRGYGYSIDADAGNV